MQTCRRIPIPLCTWWCRQGRCSAQSHGAGTTWGRPHIEDRTHITSSGSGEVKEKMYSYIHAVYLTQTLVKPGELDNSKHTSTREIFKLPQLKYLKLLWLLTFKLVLNRICLKACVLHKMASIRMITGSYSMYLSTGFWQDSWRNRHTENTYTYFKNYFVICGHLFLRVLH